ncbi:chemotaxis protein CheW [Shewanella sp. A3A]|uniref:Chemotaxis protein CheW n=1 Tax=Shewanella electrica TaxID=515560 RepID=A0ABT2FI20_9GAMM|nr:chemotaxis protein CheW [Shewanella electrica]MCH1918174.1 chemotaxis protein CheW [Shewanella ferrihydritica]MCH1924070.1 chemotaxis protein CheW [Shewanella electrica]MCS4555973.1 chemotaxis protein CheW [Shewanella electrica]
MMTAKNSKIVPANQALSELDYANFDESSQYLTFSLNQELYAFGILHVKEILEYGKVTKVPMMPEFIEGVINLRGEVIPVVNLARRFGLAANNVTRRTCIVIVEVSSDDSAQVIGVMVDSVSEVLEITSDNLRNAPSFGAAIRTDFIRAMGKIDDDFVVILAEDKVLSIAEMAMVEQVRELAEQEGLAP